MIKIRKDDNTKVVTQGAYKEFYEHLGYQIVNEKGQSLKKDKEEIKEEIKEEVKENFKPEIKEETKDKAKRENFSRK